MYPKALARYDEVLLGAKGITYLMYVGREANTVNVVNFLFEAGIIKNKDVAYAYTSQLENGHHLIKTVRTLPRPGPPKIRTAKLQPIFETIEFYRMWKLYPEDTRQLSLEEKQKLALFFQSVSSLWEYFPHYLQSHLGFPKKQKLVKMLEWTETLSIFIEFCYRITETCWEVNKWLPYGLEQDSQRIAETLRDIGSAPFGYIYDAHKTGKLTNQTIREIADFSLQGEKDKYRDSFLRELYWTFISLRNPLEAGSLARQNEEMLSAILEGQLEEIPVGSLYRAIQDKALAEFEQIENEVNATLEDHTQRDQALQRLLKCKPEDVPNALDAMIKKFKFDGSRDELMKKLQYALLVTFLEGRAAPIKTTLKMKSR